MIQNQPFFLFEIMFEVNIKAIFKRRNVVCVVRPLKDRARSMEGVAEKSKDHKDHVRMGLNQYQRPCLECKASNINSGILLTLTLY